MTSFPSSLPSAREPFMATVSDKHYRARITKRIDLAPELWVIRVDPGAEFKFTPGQYATLGVEHEEKRSERPYSIASSPYENEVEFFFELVPHAEDSFAENRRRAPHAQGVQGTLHARHRQRPQEPPSDLHRDRGRALRELRAHALQRLEGREIQRRSSPVPSERSQPLLGVRILRRAAEVRGRSALAEICPHSQPAMGRFELDRRDRPRR